MDLFRRKFEINPTQNQRTILEDKFMELTRKREDHKVRKYCEHLLGHLFSHGNTYNNQQIMLQLLTLRLRGTRLKIKNIQGFSKYFYSPEYNGAREKNSVLCLENFLAFEQEDARTKLIQSP